MSDLANSDLANSDLAIRRQRRPLVKLALRRMARRNPSRRDDILIVLHDRDLLTALANVTDERYNEYSSTLAKGEGRLLSFFNWLIEHSDEIFAIITKLLIIFAEENRYGIRNLCSDWWNDTVDGSTGLEELDSTFNDPRFEP